MNSFSDNLEMLETAPRFIDLPDLAQLRRDSGAGRLSRDSSVIFLRKRERLESGDFPALAHDSRAKTDFVSTFNSFNSPLKDGSWDKPAVADHLARPVVAEASDVTKAPVEPAHADEGESVIDQNLTVDRHGKQHSESTELDVTSPLPKPLHFGEPKFVIKVKKTESSLVVSGAHSEICQLDVNASDCELGMPEEAQEERSSNLVFADEPSRLHAKMSKVVHYWRRASLLVPNVFRHIRLCEESRENYLEMQDYSRKELLVQSNGLKLKSSSVKDKNAKKIKKGGSGNSRPARF